MMKSDETKSALLDAALQVLDRAYSPYSNVKVAAAVIDAEGRIFTGVNVENASLGLTICAERNAIGTAIGKGAKSIEAVLIVSSLGVIPPCGACRQVIAEFSQPTTPVYFADENGIEIETTIGELLPLTFKLEDNESGDSK